MRPQGNAVAELTYDTRIGYEKGALTPVYWAFMKLEQFLLKLTRSSARLSYNGLELQYVRAMYNRTWANERCAELAIVEAQLEAAERAGKDRVLEVGNVLAHYGVRGHVVVDKYEPMEGVRNIDVVEIPDSERYDLIVSISTMEHVGWDEEPRQPEKFSEAYEKLYSLLAPGGSLVVTVPVDWNEWLDQSLAAGSIPADRIDWLKRTGRYCAWQETDREAALALKYGSPYRNANGLVVLNRTRPAAGSTA